jgi:hypothetical protein
MSSIIKKGLAIKDNKLPARYYLTDAGRRLAYRILYGINDEENENIEDDVSPAKKSQVKAIDENATSNYHNFVDNFDCDDQMDDRETETNCEYNNYNDHLMNDFYERFDQEPVKTIAYSNFDDECEILLDSDSENHNKKTSKKTGTTESLEEKKDQDNCIELIDSDSDCDIIQVNADKHILNSPSLKESVISKTKMTYQEKYFKDSDDDDDMLPDLEIASPKSKPEKLKKQSEIKIATKTNKKHIQRSDSEESLTSLDNVKKKETANARSTVNNLSRFNSDASSQSTGLTQGFDNLLSTKSNNFQSNFVSSAATRVLEKKTSSFDSVQASNSSDRINTPSVVSKLLPNNYEFILYVDNCEQSHAYVFLLNVLFIQVF